VVMRKIVQSSRKTHSRQLADVAAGAARRGRPS